MDKVKKPINRSVIYNGRGSERTKKEKEMLIKREQDQREIDRA